MKKIILAVVVLASLSTVQAQTTWKVDSGHSSINFSIQHMLISEVSGNFTDFDITAKSNDTFENPNFNVTIDASTINTNNNMRDGHLKKADFFDTTNHQNIVFISTSFKQLADNKFEVTGNMTIKGISKEVTFAGKLNGIITDSHSKKLKAGLKLTTSINREAFNIGKGMSSLGDDVEVIINLEMAQQ